MLRIGFVGAGNMACALGGGLRAEGAADGGVRMVATDVAAAARERFAAETGGAAVDALADVVREADVLVLAVKPQVMATVLAELGGLLDPARHLVLSIAAGITLPRLSRGLGGYARVVRAMPNTPALVRAGITVLAPGPGASPRDMEVAERVFRAAGDVIPVADESLMDAVTALSGSGPGFFFAYAEAMLRAGEAAGLPPEMALRLLQRTLAGSAELWIRSGEPVERLRANVTSPGGTTQAGLEALEARGFAAAIRAAIEAATRRSRELSNV